jgi:hypothetical protein
MRISFRNQVNALQNCLNSFDPDRNASRYACLKNLSSLPFTINQDLLHYYEALLFVLAYPADEAQQSLAEREMLRIASFLKSNIKERHRLLVNSGLPFTNTITRFSHDKVRWLLAHPHGKTTLDDFVNPSHTLNDILRLTLPSIEQPETTAGLDNLELMDALHIKPGKRLQFIINELSRYDESPYVKDHLYDGLQTVVCNTPTDKTLSKAFNRLPVAETYFHKDLLRKIDSSAILNTAVPAPVHLDMEAKEAAVRVVKNAMLLTGRETDPCTYMDEHTFRLYQLERGISIAIYGMVPSRQMPLESYVGYTAFKNGYPVAYGGAWVFGERANFGINIFKPYRNGESAFVMAQLLRLYRHVFDIRYFEVEAYQFGLDNPEGIASGAFWFYYRFGFRSLDKQLKAIALKEEQKIKERKGYRTSEKVLVQLTGSNIGLAFGRKTPPGVQDIAIRVTKMIGQRFGGDRILAEQICKKNFLQKTGKDEPATNAENKVLNEVALWTEAMHIEERDKLEILASMIRVKPKDVYDYQRLLLRFYQSA